MSHVELPSVCLVLVVAGNGSSAALRSAREQALRPSRVVLVNDDDALRRGADGVHAGDGVDAGARRCGVADVVVFHRGKDRMRPNHLQRVQHLFRQFHPDVVYHSYRAAKSVIPPADARMRSARGLGPILEVRPWRDAPPAWIDALYPSGGSHAIGELPAVRRAVLLNDPFDRNEALDRGAAVEWARRALLKRRKILFTDDAAAIEIVVSACNDTSAVDEVRKLIKRRDDVRLTVYEKCNASYYENIRLDNVGREQHTFVHHFRTNYDALAPTTICVPGNWIKHPNRQKFVKDCLRRVESFKCIESPHPHPLEPDFQISEYGEQKMIRAEPRGLRNWSYRHVKQVGASNFTEYKTCYEGAMMVNDIHVRRNPKTVYEGIEREMTKGTNPESGHYLERLMRYLYEA